MIMAMTLLPKSIFCNYRNEMNYVFLTDEESFMGSPWPGHQNVHISFEVWFSNRKAFYDNTKHSLGLSRRSLRPHKLVGFIIWRPTVDLFAIRVHILVRVLFRNIRHSFVMKQKHLFSPLSWCLLLRMCKFQYANAESYVLGVVAVAVVAVTVRRVKHM